MTRSAASSPARYCVDLAATVTAAKPDHAAHSILSMHRNALNYKRKKILWMVKARPSVRQKFSLLISKENLRDSDFVRLQ
jgi:hypothetical protein